jgi:DNA invertase Pin-like site-specific DNA recombinase
MIKQDTKNLIRAFIEELNEEKRFDFRFLGYRKKKHRYTQKQKDFAIRLAQEKGVRATAKILGLHRKTIQRWLRAEGIWVKRCPDWVYEWAYWRRKRNEKWERIRRYRGY